MPCIPFEFEIENVVINDATQAPLCVLIEDTPMILLFLVLLFFITYL